MEDRENGPVRRGREMLGCLDLLADGCWVVGRHHNAMSLEMPLQSCSITTIVNCDAAAAAAAFFCFFIGDRAMADLRRP